VSATTYESPLRRWVRYGLIVVSLVVVIFPIYWMVISSLRPESQLFSTTPSIILETITLENYRAVIDRELFVTQFTNSVIISVSATITSITFATLAGYGWGKFTFPGSQSTALYVIVTRVMPIVSVIVPLFFILQRIGLIDTYPGLVAAYMVFMLPLTSWMLIGFFENIPENVLNAARIDGMNEFQIYVRIALPMAKPGVIATALFAFVIAWQEFIFANTFMLSNPKQTIPVMMFGMMSRYTIEWGSLMAISVIFILPVVLLFVAMQRYFIEGITGPNV
jgi:ABC-type glycerol-3-phosphate transport system permease component